MTHTHDFRRWIAGFIDGEGCIAARILKNEEITIGVELRPVVRITQEQLAGVLDAEGWIGVNISSTSKRQIGYRLRPDVRVTEGNHDLVMTVLTAYADALDVTCNVHQVSRQRNGPKDYYEWNVSGRENTRVLLESVRDFVIVKHEQVRIMLEEIIPRMERGIHTEKAGFLEVMGYVDRLNAYKGGRRGKYTQEYFAERWDIEP